MVARRGAFVFFGLLAGLLVAIPQRARADPADPLIPLINRIDSYFHRHELDGITKDPRYEQNPAETIRLSIVSQLLGFCDLYAADPRPGYYQDIVDRADFVSAHIPEILGHSAFDGMVAYSLLQAFDITHDQKYMDAALPIVNYCRGLGGFNNTLNWGLMAAMGISKYYALTGDTGALKKTRKILASCRAWQHPDGSFPHYCTWTTDVHYTGWMGMELLHIRRYVDDPNIDPMLEGIGAFLDGRVGDNGVTAYERPCGTGCFDYFDSYRSGCTVDYDTRGWINELGYSAMVFDHFDTPKYGAVMQFLYTLGPHGVFPDKWDYFPPTTDPIYPWGSADSSVIRTSVVFWSLAGIYRTRYAPVAQLTAPANDGGGIALAIAPGADFVVVPEGDTPPHRQSHGRRLYEWFAVDSLAIAGVDPSSVCLATNHAAIAGVGMRASTADHVQLRTLAPNPTIDGAVIAFRLARAALVTVAIFDATGRHVRGLVSTPFAAGDGRLSWDGRDDAGRTTMAGIYFVSVRAGDARDTGRLLVVR